MSSWVIFSHSREGELLWSGREKPRQTLYYIVLVDLDFRHATRDILLVATIPSVSRTQIPRSIDVFSQAVPSCHRLGHFHGYRCSFFRMHCAEGADEAR